MRNKKTIIRNIIVNIYILILRRKKDINIVLSFLKNIICIDKIIVVVVLAKKNQNPENRILIFSSSIFFFYALIKNKEKNT